MTCPNRNGLGKPKILTVYLGLTARRTGAPIGRVINRVGVQGPDGIELHVFCRTVVPADTGGGIGRGGPAQKMVACAGGSGQIQRFDLVSCLPVGIESDRGIACIRGAGGIRSAAAVGSGVPGGESIVPRPGGRKTCLCHAAAVRIQRDRVAAQTFTAALGPLRGKSKRLVFDLALLFCRPAAAAVGVVADRIDMKRDPRCTAAVVLTHCRGPACVNCRIVHSHRGVLEAAGGEAWCASEEIEVGVCAFREQIISQIAGRSLKTKDLGAAA